MKPLNTIIEEEKKEFEERFANSTDNKEGKWIPDTTERCDAEAVSWEDVENFLTTAMQRVCEAGRADWLRSEIEKLESKKEMEDYDVMVCSKCENVIRERTSHHSEDGFSQCCGKRLARKQGKKDTYSCFNQALTSIITRYKEELLELENKQNATR